MRTLRNLYNGFIDGLQEIVEFVFCALLPAVLVFGAVAAGIHYALYLLGVDL